MEKLFIKHKSRVTEPEFIEYLDRVCENENIKSMILDFYEILKSTETKFGRLLTIKSFGKTPENFLGVPLYTDQAKYLFLSNEDQAKDDALISQCVAKLKNNDELSDDKLREDANRQALETFQKQQEEIFGQNLEAIGVSDLFRFQFVNFMDKVSVQQTNHTALNGCYIPLEKQMILFNITDDLFTSKNTRRYFKLQNAINHELTHMLSMKTANWGPEVHFISPGAIIVARGLQGICGQQFSDLTKNRLVREANLGAENILNEVGTDFYSLYLPGRMGMFQDLNGLNHPNSPYLTSGAISEDNNLTSFTTYGEFTHIFEIIFANKNNLRKCIYNSLMPVWGQYELIKSFLENAEISSELQTEVDLALAKQFDMKEGLFKQISQFDKFKLLIGLCANHYLAGFDKGNTVSPFDENMMLAQSMILDIMQSRLLKNLEANQETLNLFLQNAVKTAEYVDLWVIKPNIKISASQENVSWAKDVYCNAHLAMLAPQNPAIKTWAKYLQTLCGCLAPEVLEKSSLLKQEFEYLKNEENKKIVPEK